MQDRIRNVGVKIRQIRLEKKMTLKEISDATNLSLSLISMIERGEANPSIGSLIAISDALQVAAGELFDDEQSAVFQPVIRKREQAVLHTSEGVSRRILVLDEKSQIQMAENTYEPGTASAEVTTRHRGKEFGVLIEGSLQIEIDNEVYTLESGDAIYYDSHHPHRFINSSQNRSKTIWVNIFSE
ncbi:cupin domain-containing protein [Candidatus Formimonas warabiya]|uniref:HTH cro/C1-type domain-containing protein n=1 Tax=Formimonas warabiya TaxID=1761012 RepID=A0A3G1KZ57_FORW1|nr:cupin domain-containing protein [Candidatus Formimonas warabiya]ATW27772.1 hypothetical protein DCMF_26165 [Candidatus Formimonas warabiya]